MVMRRLTPGLQLVVGLGALLGLLVLIWQAQTSALFRNSALDRMAHPTAFWAVMMVTSAALMFAIYWAMTAQKR
jgi:hypothetical protein